MMNVYNKSTQLLAKPQQGFLLLEAIVAVAVFGILMLSVSGYYVRMYANVTRAHTIQKLMRVATRCIHKKGVGNIQGIFIEDGCKVEYVQHRIQSTQLSFVKKHFETKIVTVKVVSSDKREEVCITKIIM